MPDQVLFAGGRIESLYSINGSVTERTTSTRFDNSFADCSLYMAGTSFFKIKFYTATANVLTETVISSGKVFIHFSCFNALLASGATNESMVEVFDSNNHPWIKIKGVSGNNYNLFYNTGTGASPVWTQAGSAQAITTIFETFDIEIILGSPHVVNVYRNGTLWRTQSFTQALFTNIASVNFGNHCNNVDFSELLVTENISTVGARVKTARATGAGNKNQWTNTHTAVNEVIGTDATVQSAASDGLISTHAMTDVTVPAGFEIKSVFHWMRAKNDGSAPLNLKSVMRQSGVDYSTGNLNGMGVGYNSIGARYDAAPDGSNWTQTKWNAIEAGYESET